MSDLKDIFGGGNATKSDLYKALATLTPILELQIPVPQRPELDKIESAVENGENVNPQEVSTLLRASMEKEGYVLQQLGRAICKLNKNGEYDVILSDAMEFAISNDDGMSITSLSTYAKPRQEILERALAYAEDLCLTSEYDGVSLQDSSVIGRLRQAINPEEVKALHNKAFEEFQKERADKQAKLAEMSADEFKEVCEKIFNPEGYKTDGSIRFVAALGGGTIAERTSVNVTKNDDSFVIRLSQRGLFPQACHEAVIDLQSWEHAKVDTNESSNRQQSATITIPHDRLLDFTNGYFVKSRGGSRLVSGPECLSPR